LVEEDQVCKIKKFNNIFSTDEGPIGKKIFNLRGEIPKWMFKGLIRIFPGLIELIEVFIIRIN
jgi:hypothetical protein